MKAVTTMLVLIGWMALGATARADSILYDNVGFIQGQQAFVQAFDITTPGTLSVTLTDVPWLDPISDLNGFLSTSSKVLGGSFGDGSESISVGPGMVYAHWFGDAQGLEGVGVYGIKVTFRPSGQSTVPLPASIVFLLSGIVLLAGFSQISAMAVAQAAMSESDAASPAGRVGHG